MTYDRLQGNPTQKGETPYCPQRIFATVIVEF